MSKAVITSYTLMDFMSEGDMNGFFSFVENQEAFVACDNIWKKFLRDSSGQFDFITKVVPFRGIVQYGLAKAFA